MRPSTPILVFALVLVLTGSCSRPEAGPDLSQHNLLLITIDTLRADRLGSYGYMAAHTPNLDRLADGGIRFQNAYTAVPLTLPAHTTLFTGRYPFATQVRQNGIHFVDNDEVTLAELFRDRGVRTSATIAAYVLTSKFGLDQGFEVYEDSLRMGDLFRFFSSIRGDEVYDRFSRWLQSNGTTPFFSWVHFYDPHLPYDPPEPYSEQFRENPYDGEIAFVDEQVGKILRDLERLQLLESTLVLVTSDHGEAFGEHVEEGHGLLCYEQTLRVPLFLFAPGQLPSGRVVNERVALVDLMPTLIDLFGLDRPPSMQGRSLVGLMTGEEGASDREVYFESLAGVKEKGWAPRTGLIAEDYKFIKVPEPELYDLAADPGETANLYERRRDVVGRLDQQLQQLLLGSESEDDPGERQLTEEDRRHLSALGYLGSTTSRAEGLIEPKRGIYVDMQLRAIRSELDRGTDLEAVERDLERVIREHPDIDTSDFYELRYRIEEARHNQAGAITALQEGIEKFPESILIFTLAYYQRQLGELDEAERLCNRILETRPKFSQAISLLGMIAEDRGELPRALQLFEQALELEPTSVPLRIQVADTRVRLGDARGASEIYDTLLDSGALDDQPGTHFKAATLHFMIGNLERAEDLFQQGLQLEPAGKHFISLALVQARSGNIEAAIQSMETALGAFSDSLTPQEIQLAESALQQWLSSR